MNPTDWPLVGAGLAYCRRRAGLKFHEACSLTKTPAERMLAIERGEEPISEEAVAEIDRTYSVAKRIGRMMQRCTAMNGDEPITPFRKT